MNYYFKVKNDFINFIKKVSLSKEIDLQLKLFKEGKILINVSDVFTKITGEYRNIEFKNFNNDNDFITLPSAKKVINYLNIINSEDIYCYRHKKIDIDKLLIFSNESNASFDIILYMIEELDAKPITEENIKINFNLSGDKIKQIFNTLKILSTDECGLLFCKNNDKYEISLSIGTSYEDECSILLYNLEENEFSEDYFMKDYIEKIDDDKYYVKYKYDSLLNVFSVIDKNDSNNISFNIKQGGGLIFKEESENYTIYYGLIPYN